MLHGCDERQPRTGIRRGARGFCPEVAPFGAAQRGSAESLRRFDIMPSVMTLRRLVLFVLLLTVPFQAAIGAAGSICSHGSSDAVTDAAFNGARAAHASIQWDTKVVTGRSYAGASLAHGRATGHDHARHAHPAAAAVDEQQSAPAADERNQADRCSVCSECSCSAIAAVKPGCSSVLPTPPLKITAYTDPAVPSHVGDALFRPPRLPAS